MYLKFFFLFILLTTSFVAFFQKEVDIKTIKNFSKNQKAKNIISVVQNKKNPNENFVISASKMHQQADNYLLEKLFITSGNKNLKAKKASWKNNELLAKENVTGKWNDSLYKAQRAKWDFKNQKINFTGSFSLSMVNPISKLTAKRASIQKDLLQASGNVVWQILNDYRLKTRSILLTPKILQSSHRFQLKNQKLDYLLTADSFSYNFKDERFQAKNNVIFKNKDQSLKTQELLFAINDNSISVDKEFIFNSSKDNIKLKASAFFYNLTTKKMEVKGNAEIELEKFFVIGQNFVLDFREQTIISKQATKIKDKKNNFDLSSESFLYNIKDQSLLVK